MASRGVNKVILLGNLGADPVVRFMPNGGAVANLSVATGEVWKDKHTGQQQERTEWHRVVLFQRLGEIAGEYLKKGSKVYIEGRLQTRQWEKDGVKHYTTEIVGEELRMLGGPADEERPRPQHGDGGAAAYRAASGGSGGAAPRREPPPSVPYDDDIPF